MPSIKVVDNAMITHGIDNPIQKFKAKMASNKFKRFRVKLATYDWSEKLKQFKVVGGFLKIIKKFTPEKSVSIRRITTLDKLTSKALFTSEEDKMSDKDYKEKQMARVIKGKDLITNLLHVQQASQRIDAYKDTLATLQKDIRKEQGRREDVAANLKLNSNKERTDYNSALVKKQVSRSHSMGFEKGLAGMAVRRVQKAVNELSLITNDTKFPDDTALKKMCDSIANELQDKLVVADKKLKDYSDSGKTGDKVLKEDQSMFLQLFPKDMRSVSFLFKLKIQYITAIICLSRLIKPDCMNYIMPLNISYNLVSYDVSKGIILASPAPLIIV